MSKDNYGKWSDSESESLLSPADSLYYNRMRNKSGFPAEVHPSGSGGYVSNSDLYLNQKYASESPVLGIKKDTLSKVTANRQEYIQSILDKKASSREFGAPLPAIVRNSSILKNASAQTAGSRGRSDTIHMTPEPYSPFFLTQNLQLPKDILTANAWNRAYYETNPIVRNAVNLHATYPISKMSIKCADKKVEQFFQDMMERVSLETVVQHAALEFWKCGECFVYAAFDEHTGMWSKIYIHNPDYIAVEGSPIPGLTTISLKPDPKLQKIITSNDPAHARIRESLDPRIVHHVLMNEYIPLDSFNISHLKNLSSPYDVRGTSIIVSVWKDLMLYDKLRESKFVQADGMINPMTLVKVGSSNPDGHYPGREELEMYREILEQAQNDRDFKLVTHDAVDITRVGYQGSVMDVASDFTMIIDNILMGLMVPKAILTQEGATYASASVALDVMRQRYNNFRTLMSNWLEQKIFAPISEVQKFYKYEAGVKRLIVPQVEWNHMTLYDMDSYLGHIIPLVDKQRVSVETVYRSLGLNRDNELTNIRKESIEAAIVKKETMELDKMPLTQLRALDPMKPIPEYVGPALPGAPGGPGAPGSELPGAGFDALMGGGAGPPGAGPPGAGPPMDMGGPPMDMGGPPMDMGGPPMDMGGPPM